MKKCSNNIIVFITGITSGFGKSMAIKLFQEGYKVYGTYRKEPERIKGINYIKADVCSINDIQNAINTILDKENRIDIFINNAGMGIGGPIEYSNLDDIAKQMDTNWMGFIRCLHTIVPIMRRQNFGKIICLSSIGGIIGLPFQGIYSASKFAIEGTAEALRLELRHTNIKIIVIEPGDFSTGFTSSRKKVTDNIVLSDYPTYRKYLDSYEKDELNGLKPDYLAKKISRIIKSNNPKYRYIVATPIQKLSVYLKKLLPGRLFAKIFVSHYM